MFSLFKHKLFKQPKVYLCDKMGHRWRYKDYSNYIKSDGDKYEFVASRNCTVCDQYAYYNKGWENREKSSYDFENHNFYTDNVIIDSVLYK